MLITVVVIGSAFIFFQDTADFSTNEDALTNQLDRQGQKVEIISVSQNEIALKNDGSVKILPGQISVLIGNETITNDKEILPGRVISVNLGNRYNFGKREIFVSAPGNFVRKNEDLGNPCGNRIIVPTPNPGLEKDCEILLNARDELAGTTILNWTTDTEIMDWEGITVRNRVIHLILNRKNLNGQIPAELGNLTELRRLMLLRNNLTGEIPEELGNLRNLEINSFVLNGNKLTGCIPRTLDRFPRNSFWSQNGRRDFDFCSA